MLSPFADDRSLFKIIRAAQRAPSVFNTQPWSFWVRADDRIELRANTSGDDRHPDRWLEVTDPVSRELAISCGAALFNVRMAIRVTGHELAAWLLPDPEDDPTLLASVEIVTGRVRPPTGEEQELYAAIPNRHTYRWPFTGQRVHANVLTELERTAARERAYLRVLYPFQATSWLHAAGEAERELIRDERYVAELRRWTSGAGPGLGIPKTAYGPQPPLTLMNPPVRDFGFDWGDGRPIARFESHPQLLSLATDYDRPLDWLRAGQALQRALLTAAHYGVAASFLTQPLEFAVKRQLADNRRTGRRWLPDSLRLPGRIQLADNRHNSRRWPNGSPFDKAPQMLIRVGYPDRDGPQTPREDAPQVIDLRGGTPRLVLPPARPHLIGP